MRHTRFIVLSVMLIFCLSFSILAQKKNVDPVNWRKLTPFLVEIPGWSADGDAKGSSMTMGEFKVSEAHRNYTSGDKRLTIKIVDGGYVPLVYTSIKMAMNYEIDTSEEYVKKITVKDFQGIETYNYEDKEASVMIIVADRFIVEVREENAENASGTKAVAEILDLKKLAALAAG